MFWILSAFLLLVVIALIAAWLRRTADEKAIPAAAYDLQVYRDQLREVERDLARGVVRAGEAARLRDEIGRKVLDADRRLEEGPAPAQRGQQGIAIFVLLALMVAAAGLYWTLGAPETPDLPLSKRIAAANESYLQRPTQAEAEARAPQRDTGAVDAEFVALVEQLRAAVEKNPDDPRGLELLVDNELRLGNFAKARAAQQKLVELRGDSAGAADWLRLSAVMSEAAGGLITAEAEEALAQAMKLQPDMPQAQYMVGLLQLQNGRPDRAFPIWKKLLEDDAPVGIWQQPIRANIEDLAWLAGQPDYVPPEPSVAGMPALPGPDAEAIAAAEQLDDAQQQEMVEAMVAGLENRLATQGGTPQEWARLIASLGVLGQSERAKIIFDEAQQRFGATPDAIAPIRAAAEQAGLLK